MAMRLALVIDGDSKGAQKAIEDTTSALSSLKNEAAAAVKPTGDLAGKTASLTDEASKAAPALGKAAVALVPIGERGAKAAKGIDLTTTAARRATGGLGGFSTALGAVATGLVAGGIVAGFTLLADQTIRWVGAILDNSDEIKADLEAHDGLIGRIAKKYQEAASGASDFGRESAAGLRFEAQQNVRRLEPRSRVASESAATGLSGDLGLFDLEEDFGPFEGTIRKFREEITQGAGDVNAFRKEIAEIAGDLPDESPFRAVAEGIRETTDKASKLQSKLGKAQAVLKGLEGDSEAASNALGRLPKGFEDAGAAAERSAKSLALFRGEFEALSGGTSGGLNAPAASTGSVPAVPFAAGGIVTRPTMFRFGAGQLGIMGEAGPEAIMPMNGGQVGAIGNDNSETSLPLARMASGKLGVRMPQGFASGGVIGAVSGGLKDLASDFLRGGETSDVFGGALERLKQKLLDSAINNVLQGLFGSTGGGSQARAGGGLIPPFVQSENGGSGLFSNVLGSLFSGFFEQGGVIAPGRWGIAGESGPEIVSGGPTGVTVTPFATGGVFGLSDKPGSRFVSQGTAAPASPSQAGSTVNNFFVSTPDAKSFAEDRISVIRGASRAVAQAERFS